MWRLSVVELPCVEAATSCLQIQNKAAITCLHHIFINLILLLKFADNTQCQDRKEKHPGLV